MADRQSLESAPTVVSDAAGAQPGNLKGNPAIAASPSYDTKTANAASPALHFPLNYFRIVWEFCTVLVLLPYHFVKFALFPSTRWRRSWTLLEATLMPAVKRIMAAMDLCGFKISSRDTDAEPSALGKWWMRVRYNGARFEWVEGLPDELVNGELADKEVKIRRRVGMFGWAREDAKGHGLIGLYLHGGGIPSTLFKRRSSIDCYLIIRCLPLYKMLLPPTSPFYGVAFLVAASWIRDMLDGGADDEQNPFRLHLRKPAGLVLLSPWSDPCASSVYTPSAHSYLGHTPQTYVPRSNSCDYLFEKGAFRLHLVTSLLGSHPQEYVKSPYVSPGARDTELGILNGFPPVFVHYGTGERCQEEGERLVANLRRDGVHVEVVVTEDTPHDLLLLAMIWRKEQVEQIWTGALRFIETLL
ncbi:hypothetical protein Rhopal_005628-T1 [Rhodotorula paludigena]|uniref:Alpha/beta hydrolase fold-3 domain-containing protein n=1 Tax=Rhodotorula paludigena TaxID=86838 RepID=A0AAV5GQX9_9BASI|nr:hypothetical protein Rhopal_005628-T1 [Rhodotorula paludigena]